MRLIDTQIKMALADGRIAMVPSPSDNDITGVSVDVKLGNEFKVFNTYTTPFIDLKDVTSEQINDVMSDTITIDENGRFILHPGQLALGVTLEHVTISSDLVGWLDGRSSLARLGLQVHVTAHRIDPGWAGKIVLEFYNTGPIPLALCPGMKIGALNFEQLVGDVQTPYRSKQGAKYVNQSTVESSKLGDDE